MRVTRASTSGLAVAVIAIGLGLALLLLATRPPREREVAGSPPPERILPARIDLPASIAAPASSREASAEAAADAPSVPAEVRPTTFEARRAAHPTRLLTRGPVPLPGGPAPAPPGVEVVTYPSCGMKLRAWFALPEPRTGLVPVVVYLHRGLALDGLDWERARLFLEAGYAVLLPTFRGEAGNPGAFELLRGELDDALAACHWAAASGETDAHRVYAFGDDVGGALAGLLSLVEDAPVRLTGSAGGLWSEFVFDAWTDVPFDPHDAHERGLRGLATNLDVMRRPHLAFVGQQDDEVMEDVPLLTRRASRVSAPLEVILVRGDHATSVPQAVREFIERIR